VLIVLVVVQALRRLVSGRLDVEAA
jgi:hypothetical protein